jgi:hypothetical protein
VRMTVPTAPPINRMTPVRAFVASTSTPPTSVRATLTTSAPCAPLPVAAKVAAHLRVVAAGAVAHAPKLRAR